MTVCLLLISDGRDEYRDRALASLEQYVPPVFAHRVEIADCDHRLGFAGAIQAGWDAVLETGADWVMHLELDFTFRAPVPLDRMIHTLHRHSEIAQLVLKRQPWNADECAAGGIVEQHPDDYVERSERIPVIEHVEGWPVHRPDADVTWTEHRRFWSTNPSIYSTDWCKLGWPQQTRSEEAFTRRLLRDPLLGFAFWGAKHSAPLVDHIGAVRIGLGY